MKALFFYKWKEYSKRNERKIQTRFMVALSTPRVHSDANRHDWNLAHRRRMRTNMMKMALTTKPKVVMTRLNLVLMPLLLLLPLLLPADVEEEEGSVPKTETDADADAITTWGRQRTLLFIMLESIHVMCTKSESSSSWFNSPNSSTKNYKCSYAFSPPTDHISCWNPSNSCAQNQDLNFSSSPWFNKFFDKKLKD